MVSKARAKSTGKGKGKRRAVSSVSSDSSDNEIGEAWVASRAKRVKTEQSDEFDESSAVAIGQEIERDEATAPTPVKRQPDSSDVSEGDDINVDNEDGADAFKAPADLLEILSTAGITTIKFQGRIEEVVDNSFKVAPQGNEAPGIGYIESILDCLKGNDVARGRVQEVSQHLSRTRRHKIAEYLGSIISSSEELRETLNAVVAALTFQVGHNGLIFRPPSHTQAEVPPAECPETQETIVHVRDGAADGAMAGSGLGADEPRKRAKRESLVSESGVDAAIAPSNNESSCVPGSQTMQTRSCTTEVAGTGGSRDSLAPAEKGLTTPKECLPEAFDLFFYAISNLKLSGIDGDIDAYECLREHAKTIFDSMDSEQGKRWRRVHKKVRKGGKLDQVGMECQAMLDEQRILEKLHLDCLAPNRFEACLQKSALVERISMQPMLIPSGPRKTNAHCCAMVVVNTPEAPGINPSQNQLTSACVRACGDALNVQKVERANDHVWVITFATTDMAKRAKGRLLDLGGAQVKMEHLYSNPPLIFTCDFSDVHVNDEEIAGRLAEVFAKNGTKPLVRMQEHSKLYKGRFLWVSLPSTERLIRFYIPMLRNDLKEVFMACFKPINRMAPCALCRFKHGTDPCSTSRSIELPLN